MKMKQVVMITNPMDFKRGRYNHCFGLCNLDAVEGMIECGWIAVAPIEFEVAIEGEQVDATIRAALDREKSELRAKINLIEQQEKELFSISYQPEPIKPTPTEKEMYGDDV
jgi:hypothetical protein